MELFDAVAAMTGLGSGTAQAQQHSRLLAAAMEYINSLQVGGISGLQQMFHEKGLGGVVSSWIGAEQNLPISSERLQSVLHRGALQQIAQKAGIDPSQASSILASLLPNVIDKLTLNGQVPDSGALAHMMEGLPLRSSSSLSTSGC